MSKAQVRGVRELKAGIVESPNIAIVGCGPGAPDYVTAAAMEAVGEAEVLVGARRLLDLFPASSAERIEFANNAEEILTEIGYRRKQRIAVLVTGDPGLCSLAKPVLRRFGLKHCRVIPGVSSIQVAFARIGLDWLDARIIDAHGKDPEIDPESLNGWGKIAVLGGGKGSLCWLVRAVERLQGDFLVFICENLTFSNERVMAVEPGNIEGVETGSRTIFLLVKREFLL